MNAQQQEEEECSAARILVGAKRCASMNRRCSPSTASSDSDGVLNKANEEAVSNSITVSEAGSTHNVSLKSESSSRHTSANNESSSSKPIVSTGACHDVSPLPQFHSILLWCPKRMQNGATHCWHGQMKNLALCPRWGKVWLALAAERDPRNQRMHPSVHWGECMQWDW